MTLLEFETHKMKITFRNSVKVRCIVAQSCFYLSHGIPSMREGCISTISKKFHYRISTRDAQNKGNSRASTASPLVGQPLHPSICQPHQVKWSTMVVGTSKVLPSTVSGPYYFFLGQTLFMEKKTRYISFKKQSFQKILVSLKDKSFGGLAAYFIELLAWPCLTSSYCLRFSMRWVRYTGACLGCSTMKGSNV